MSEGKKLSGLKRYILNKGKTVKCPHKKCNGLVNLVEPDVITEFNTLEYLEYQCSAEPDHYWNNY